MKTDEIVIDVKDVRKKFKLYFDKGHTLKERAISAKRNKYEEREVLKGISFQIKKGEAVGLVGHNGCGKSTTLKMLTRIMYPDSGSIEIKGRVSSLLELGAGFHPDLSGRENIYINASIFGLNKKEIESKIDDIIAFSELEEFIDNPVRTYSSGMYMRLAFSVAINVNADVLLIDEILGVGDVNFQTKCFNKLMEIKGKGTTIVIVSHSTSQIEKICDRSIWIQDGKIEAEGSPIDVHRLYLNYMRDQRNVFDDTEESVEEVVEIEESTEENIEASEEENKEKKAKEIVSVSKIQLVDKDGKKKKVFYIRDKVVANITLYAKQLVKDYSIEINLVRADGLFCFGTSTAGQEELNDAWKGNKEISLAFEEMNLVSGKYHLDLHVADAYGGTIFFGGNIAEFEIDNTDVERGLFYLNHNWMKG